MMEVSLQLVKDTSIGSTVAVAQPFQFASRELDSETGLYYNRARYYDPQLMRFISEDPLGLVAGLNSYAYVNNDPADFTDPSGLCVGEYSFYYVAYNGDIGLQIMCPKNISPFTPNFGGGVSSVAGNDLGARTDLPMDPGSQVVRQLTRLLTPAEKALQAYAAGTVGLGVLLSTSPASAAIGGHPAYVRIGQFFGSRVFTVPDWMWARLSGVSLLGYQASQMANDAFTYWNGLQGIPFRWIGEGGEGTMREITILVALGYSKVGSFFTR